MKTVNKVLIIVITVLLAVIAGVTLFSYIRSGKLRESAQVVEEEKDSANNKSLPSEDETKDETKEDSEVVNSEEEDETEKHQEKPKQERIENPEIFSVGAENGAIVRGDYLYLLTNNEIQIYNRASRKLVDQLQGSMSYQMLATDDGLYFADGNDLYYYSLRDHSVTLCVSGVNIC